MAIRPKCAFTLDAFAIYCDPSSPAVDIYDPDFHFGIWLETVGLAARLPTCHRGSLQINSHATSRAVLRLIHQVVRPVTLQSMHTSSLTKNAAREQTVSPFTLSHDQLCEHADMCNTVHHRGCLKDL